MYVLGIETSCDETAAAVVKDGAKVLSSEISSSLRFHKKYSGVIPEIASRMQLEAISAVTDRALKGAGVNLKNIGLISVTSGPGLLGSLLTGISFAKGLSLALNIPLLGINHVHGHIYASMLSYPEIKLPFVALVVSGGHTSLFYIRDFSKVDVLGETQDDACGEAFDKVAKVLGLGYPGGPVIEKMAKQGNPRKIKFRCSGTSRPLDFSFSGIKTAVLYYARKHMLNFGLEPKEAGVAMPKDLIADVAASFQESVIETLVSKSILACKLKRVKQLVTGGGVLANNRLREKLSEAALPCGIKCFFPAKGHCLDNAAMVAGLGFRLFKKGFRSGLNLNADLN